MKSHLHTLLCQTFTVKKKSSNIFRINFFAALKKPIYIMLLRLIKKEGDVVRHCKRIYIFSSLHNTTSVQKVLPLCLS